MEKQPNQQLLESVFNDIIHRSLFKILQLNTGGDIKDSPTDVFINLVDSIDYHAVNNRKLVHEIINKIDVYNEHLSKNKHIKVITPFIHNYTNLLRYELVSRGLYDLAWQTASKLFCTIEYSSSRASENILIDIDATFVNACRQFKIVGKGMDEKSLTLKELEQIDWLWLLALTNYAMLSTDKSLIIEDEHSTKSR